MSVGLVYTCLIALYIVTFIGIKTRACVRQYINCGKWFGDFHESALSLRSIMESTHRAEMFFQFVAYLILYLVLIGLLHVAGVWLLIPISVIIVTFMVYLHFVKKYAKYYRDQKLIMEKLESKTRGCY